MGLCLEMLRIEGTLPSQSLPLPCSAKYKLRFSFSLLSFLSFRSLGQTPFCKRDCSTLRPDASTAYLGCSRGAAATSALYNHQQNAVSAAEDDWIPYSHLSTQMTTAAELKPKDESTKNPANTILYGRIKSSPNKKGRRPPLPSMPLGVVIISAFKKTVSLFSTPPSQCTPDRRQR